MSLLCSPGVIEVKILEGFCARVDVMHVFVAASQQKCAQGNCEKGASGGVESENWRIFDSSKNYGLS
jgi:hypothetical protein